MSGDPLVSVCIPAYNCEKYVSACIESVLSQTFHNIEIIVIDDCSTDATWERLQEFSDPRLSLSKNTRNLGAEQNWNACLEQARGKYIQFLPSDDQLYPEAIAKRVAVLEASGNRDLSFVFSARHIVDAEDKRVMTALLSKAGRRDRSDLVRQNVTRGMNVIGEPACVLFRSSCAMKAGGFSAKLPYLIDLDYWIRLLEFGDAWCLAEPLCSFRLTGQNWTFRLKSERRDNYLALIDAIAGLPWVNISRTSVMTGKARAYLNELLRVLFYKFVVKV